MHSNKPFDGQKVFLLEDEAFLYEIMQEILEQAGAQVVGAKSIAGAKQILKEEINIDLAICDLHLPDGAGTEICSLMKSMCEDIITVILSGNLNMSEEDKRDVDFAFQKPLQFTKFFEALTGSVIKPSADKN